MHTTRKSAQAFEQEILQTADNKYDTRLYMEEEGKEKRLPFKSTRWLDKQNRTTKNVNVWGNATTIRSDEESTSVESSTLHSNENYVI